MRFLPCVLLLSTLNAYYSANLYCGDGICDATESVETCPTDCAGSTSTLSPTIKTTLSPSTEGGGNGYCGDGLCDNTESFETCPNDCPSTDDNTKSDDTKSDDTKSDDHTKSDDDSSNILTYPTVIESEDSTWSATLTVRVNRHTNQRLAFTTRQYCYQDLLGLDQCSHPGPTIKVKPGDHFTLTLVNELEPDLNTTMVMNTMQLVNTTNMHTHGLHIDPNVDTIFTNEGSGGKLTYNYEILGEHFPGNYWYHAHQHGSSTLQIMGGLAGALIVQPSGSENLPSSIVGADAHLIVVTVMVLTQEQVDGEVSQGCGFDWACDPATQAPLCTGDETESPFNPFRLYTYYEISALSGDLLDPKIEFFNNAPVQDTWMVNGQVEPTLTITQNSPTILTVIHTAGGEELQLEMDGCVMTALSWDGVYLNSRLQQDIFFVPAGGRVDLEVLCAEAGHYELRSQANLLMKLVTEEGTIKSAVTNEELASIVRPSYLDDLQGDDLVPDDTYAVHLSQGNRDNSVCAFWMGAGADCSMVSPWGTDEPSPTNKLCPFSTFNGEKGLDPATYKEAYKLVTKLGNLNEWSIYGLGNSRHPLHIHVNHFQVIAFEEDDSDWSHGTDQWFQPGQWRDTIPAFEGKLTIRFRPAHFTGETVIHCHFLRHEDLGMMDTFLIQDNSTEG